MRTRDAALLLAVVAVAAVAAPARASEPEGLTDVELARAQAARASVARVRFRDGRFGDLTATRNAVVVRRDGLLLMAGLPPTRRGSFTALLHDGRELRARVVASDMETALTLLRVPTTGLVPVAGATAPRGTPPAPPAPPTPPALTPPRLGARLLMVTGDGAVAAGPVRAYGRHGRWVDPVARERRRTTGLVGVALAAVDADVGAPLLDAAGRLAGLVVGRKDSVETAGRARVPRGVAARPTPVEVVAVPGAVVRMVWPLLERHGHLPRAGLGVDTQAADEPLRQHLGLTTGGHVIRRVVPDGTAARQGLRVHDVIVSLEGRTTPPGTTLHDVLLPFRPGARVRAVVIRGGKRLELPLVLGARDAR